MTNHAYEGLGVSLVERRTAENVNTLMFRAHVSARQVAARTGMSSPTLSRKLRVGGWTLAELVVLARFFSVNLEELTGELPSLTAWVRRGGNEASPGDSSHPGPDRLPRLDSNQEPSGYASAQVIPLNRAVARNAKVKAGPVSGHNGGSMPTGGSVVRLSGGARQVDGRGARIAGVE